MAETVNPQLPLPTPSASDPQSILRTFIAWANALLDALFAYGKRLNACLPKDGTEAMTGGLQLASYTTATKPAASTANKGVVIYVSDGGAGNVFQGSNGSTWVSLG